MVLFILPGDRHYHRSKMILF